tara:strand:- start:691 stop:828 length:138 start_codon:yes stop_codon:yes gene_type:complete
MLYYIFATRYATYMSAPYYTHYLKERRPLQEKAKGSFPPFVGDGS